MFVITGGVVAISAITPILNGNGFRLGLLLWLFASFVGSIATLLFPSSAFGEPDGYLELALLPGIIFTVYGYQMFGFSHVLILIAVIIIGLILVAIYWTRTSLGRSPEGGPEWNELVEWLQDVDQNGIIVHPVYASRQVAWETGHMIVDFLHNEEASTNQSGLLFSNSNNQIINDMKAIRYYFNPQFVVFKKGVGGHGQVVPSTSDSVFENELYAIYNLDDLITDGWADKEPAT